MKTTKEPQRAWLYARVPGNYIETKNTLNVLMLQAQRDGAEVVGWGYDIHHGWLRRPAYRRMMREAKAGHIERIYICRMSQISGTERHLISFFRRLMRYKVNVIGKHVKMIACYHFDPLLGAATPKTPSRLQKSKGEQRNANKKQILPASVDGAGICHAEKKK